MKSSPWFKVFLIFLLGGIFLELLVLIGVLVGEANPRGDVAVVEVRGVMDEARPTVASLKKFSENETVKAIVLRIDSPGGPAGAAQEIHEAVLEAKKAKKVVVSMGDVAASGGYYASAGADRIVALPGTVTGSIGVIAHYFVVGDLLKKLSLQWETVHAGEMKDMGSPLRPLKPAEKKILQETMDDVHDQFIEAIVSGRALPEEKVRKIADGRIFSGRQALKLGLVDELGGLEKAIKVAAKLAQVEGKPEVIYPKREAFEWLRKAAEAKLSLPRFQLEYRSTR